MLRRLPHPGPLPGGRGKQKIGFAIFWSLSCSVGEEQGKDLVRVCSVRMRMGLALRLALSMAVGVPVVVTVGVRRFLRLRRTVTAEVVVMAMRWRRNHGFGNPALFTNLRLFGRFVIVLVASALGVSGEPS